MYHVVQDMQEHQAQIAYDYSIVCFLFNCCSYGVETREIYSYWSSIQQLFCKQLPTQEWDWFYPYPNLPLYCTHWHNAETSSTYTSNSLHLLSSHLHYHHPISMVLFLGCSSHCCHYGSNLALSCRPNMNPNYSQNFPKGFIQTSHTVLGLLWIVGGSHSDIWWQRWDCRGEVTGR